MYSPVTGEVIEVNSGLPDALETLGDDPANPPPEVGGGNFVFLLEDNLNDGHAGASSPIPGHAAGHNVLAPGHALGADATLTTAPGGSFPAGQGMII